MVTLPADDGAEEIDPYGNWTTADFWRIKSCRPFLVMLPFGVLGFLMSLLFSEDGPNAASIVSMVFIFANLIAMMIAVSIFFRKQKKVRAVRERQG